MRRLAGLFHIDVVSIHSMWIIRDRRLEQKTGGLAMLENVREFLVPYSKTVVADIYENDMVVLMESPSSLAEEETLAKQLLERIGEADTALTLCNHLKDTAAVRNAYLMNQKYLRDARKIYPGKSLFGNSPCRDKSVQSTVFVRDPGRKPSRTLCPEGPGSGPFFWT